MADQIQTLTLDDGRRAERHVSTDPQGNEVVEIFAEEPRPLKLEKRIVREKKQIVCKETHQTVKDGEICLEEVHSLEPEVPLQIRSRIGTVEHAKLVDGDYVRKDEVHKLITQGVMEGVEALLERTGTQPEPPVVVAPAAPAPKQSWWQDKWGIAIFTAVIAVEAAFMAWAWLF